MSVQDLLLVAVAVAAFAGCLGVRLALWWAGPRKAASRSIDAGVAYLQSLPPSEALRLPLRAPVEPVLEPVADITASHGDFEIAAR